MLARFNVVAVIVAAEELGIGDIMLPKQGLDFTLNKIFEYPFITVERGTATRNPIRP